MIYNPVIGDPDSGIAAGTAFTDIPDDWSCPICGATKKPLNLLRKKLRLQISNKE